MSADLGKTLTEHQKNWWGIQKCRRCNPLGLPERHHPVICPDCGGSGWTKWAALATEPWTEIIPGLFIGGHDFNASAHAREGQEVVTAYPRDEFDLVVSMYYRGFDFNPTSGDHLVQTFNDSALTPEIVGQVHTLSRIVADRHQAGERVLVRCQAGLNRSSLVAGAAMVRLGMNGSDVVQVIRARRSPWALCNDDYAQFLSSGAEQYGAPE